MTTTQRSILLILPASNFNEQEYLTVKNLLGKKGFNIFIASDANSLCIGSNGLRVKADVNFYNMHVQNFAAVVFIGGEGVRNYWDNLLLHKIAIDFNKEKKIVAAICSAPIILSNAGILSERNVTCYPADKKEIEKKQTTYKDEPVVVCGNIITAQSPAASSEFANLIASHLSK
jgi:4-methyl-5(b-hydroxyethyl)-thiazole monophosphate biosynthesis